MPFTTKRQALSLAADEKQRLESLRRSRSGEKREVLHAGILLELAGGMSDGAAARVLARLGALYGTMVLDYSVLRRHFAQVRSVLGLAVSHRLSIAFRTSSSF